MQTEIGRGRFLALLTKNSYEYVTRVRGTIAVGIVAVTEQDELLLVEQPRVPLGKNVIEIPAGLVGDHDRAEAWQVAAARELLEETGHEAERFELLTGGPTSAGLTDEQVLLVRAIGVKRVGEVTGDGHEQITLHRIKLAEVRDFLAKRFAAGTPIDAKVYAALYFVGASRT